MYIYIYIYIPGNYSCTCTCIIIIIVLLLVITYQSLLTFISLKVRSFTKALPWQQLIHELMTSYKKVGKTTNEDEVR